MEKNIRNASCSVLDNGAFAYDTSWPKAGGGSVVTERAESNKALGRGMATDLAVQPKWRLSFKTAFTAVLSITLISALACLLLLFIPAAGEFEQGKHTNLMSMFQHVWTSGCGVIFGLMAGNSLAQEICKEPTPNE